ncbi:MAG: TrkH family potassium uptake protein [Arenicellales bacterium]|jgi:trk system potassium uptake protein TrkH|nr:potassium transporter [Acidiferrobacteraceae bacterium]MDP6289060.1 TrkH family potassium uptake protein [Arenicellales bacterium]MDP6434233.1 TrkH family potassium uptake protein [Arenicellales bacterium]MDP6671838.1 TrkH family potassium uptake protein [Arenicellales bacterium]MDP6723973.1 TrkH family potassium uptake protein [Arenicellales bacterium]|tara:strand:- start:9881 stop:11332 length:1452 start_codon:yes stop_codon:yes gene_type:complete
MQYQVVLRVLGILLMIFSSTHLPPFIIAIVSEDGASQPFLIAWGVTLATGALAWSSVRHHKHELRYRDGFMIVVLFWSVLAAFGALPFLFAERPEISITNAFFESMSGLTTTGATILTGIDDLPISIRYYRQQLQWLGGMGIVVLAVAVMPMLGVGGMQLYRAETPGPLKDSKLTPRITETAKALWYIYLGLTIVCAISYRLAGMSTFDAITHSFSTVAIGGFSTHDASLGFFPGHGVMLISMIFMLLSGVNFALHFSAWRIKSIRGYFKDNETVVYFSIVAVAGVITSGVLLFNNTFDHPADALWNGWFQVVSVATTTGFTINGFSWWPSLLPVMLIIMSAIGGCAGSTAGGMKVIRALLLFKQGRREISKLVHPNALIPIKLNGRPVPEGVITSVWGFFALYVLSYVCLSLVMTITDSDLVTAFSSVTACLNNLGPALGNAAENYSAISSPGKWVLAFTMLLGRLELFTLLVLLSRSFWRN